MSLIEQLLNGLAIGCMYALVASGLSLIWGTMRMLNFAHGEFYMLGGFIMFYLHVSLGLHPVLAGILTLIGVALIGALFQLTVVQKLLSQPGWDVSPIVATLGLSIFLQNLALKLWGERFKNIPYYVDFNISLGPIHFSGQRLLIIIVSVVVILLMWAYMKYSKMGMAIRATAQDNFASKLMGISVKKIYVFVFGLSSALAALASVMIAPIESVHPWMGASPALKAFTVVVLGGLGSLEGAIIGGLLLGIIESVSVTYLSSEWKDVVSFGILILVLAFKPNGLFGKKE